MESVEIRLSNFMEKNRHEIEFIGAQNGKIKEVVAIINNTKPNKNNFFVIDGIWAHQKALNNNLEVDSFIFCEEIITSHEGMNLVEEFFKLAKKTYCVSLKTFMKICEKDDPKGMISICKFPLSNLDDIKLDKNNIVIVLDGLEIPGNVGTILRTCDGANIDAVFICNRRARITHPKIVKGSMGAAFTKPVIEFSSVEECKKWLKKKNFKIFLTDTRATKTYFEESYEGRVALKKTQVQKFLVVDKEYNNQTTVTSSEKNGKTRKCLLAQQ